MTFSNPAYGPGTFVRCDVCRDPEALQEPRHHSEAIFPDIRGNTEAEQLAVSRHAFVRVGWRLLCGGCAKVERPRRGGGAFGNPHMRGDSMKLCSD